MSFCWMVEDNKANIPLGSKPLRDVNKYIYLVREIALNNCNLEIQRTISLGELLLENQESSTHSHI